MQRDRTIRERLDLPLMLFWIGAVALCLAVMGFVLLLTYGLL